MDGCGTGDAVVTAFVEVRWGAVAEGWPGVTHNWALSPLGSDNETGKREERIG